MDKQFKKLADEIVGLIIEHGDVCIAKNRYIDIISSARASANDICIESVSSVSSTMIECVEIDSYIFNKVISIANALSAEVYDLYKPIYANSAKPATISQFREINERNELILRIFKRVTYVLDRAHALYNS
jgi:hypothetical protein